MVLCLNTDEGEQFDIPTDTEIPCKSKQRKTELDNELIKNITTDLEPFNGIQKKDFVGFSKKFDLRYSLPDTETISNTLLPDLHTNKIMFIEYFKFPKYVALTSHMFTLITSVSGDSYSTVMSHFFLEWDLKFTVLATRKMILRHTAINITKGIQSVLKNISLLCTK